MRGVSKKAVTFGLLHFALTVSSTIQGHVSYLGCSLLVGSTVFVIFTSQL